MLLAEVVHHYFPKYVELHNYSSANSVRQKLYNWSTLNNKVFKRLDFEVKKADIEAIVNCKPGVIELILLQTQQKVRDRARARSTRARGGSGGAPRARHQGQPRAARPARLYRRAPLLARKSQISDLRARRAAGELSPAAADMAGSVVSTYASSSGAPAAGGDVARALHMTAGATAGAGAAADAEKDATIAELRETVEIQELKIRKLEQLVKLKDQRIQALTARLTPVVAGSA